jgi:hypothetical protein
MTTENLYWVLDPDAYAKLREGFKRQAECERREAIERFGATGWQRLLALSRRGPMQLQSLLRPQKA